MRFTTLFLAAVAGFAVAQEHEEHHEGEMEHDMEVEAPTSIAIEYPEVSETITTPAVPVTTSDIAVVWPEVSFTSTMSTTIYSPVPNATHDEPEVIPTAGASRVGAGSVAALAVGAAGLLMI